MLSCVFFFQAEDGIRDGHVTGVQTCALPIYHFLLPSELPRQVISEAGCLHLTAWSFFTDPPRAAAREAARIARQAGVRSEERRVGKEGRPRRTRQQYKKRVRAMRMLREVSQL